MGIQILPEGQGGFASSFGNALGQGVSQQLPEEIKRYRVKSGLEELGNKNIQDPYQLLSQLATIPGLDPGLLGVLAPALQSQIGRGQAGAGFGTPVENPTGTPGISNTPPQPQGAPKLSPQGVNAPETEPLNQLATNLLRSQPFNYPNIQSATAEADKRIGNVENEFEKQTKAFLQKGKELQEGEIGGDVLDLMRQKAIQDLALTGKSERSIAQKYARQAKEIAKDYDSIRKVNSDTGFWREADEGTIDGLRNTAKRLTDLGVPQDQILDNLQTKLNISRSAASYIQNPMKNTEAGKFLAKLPENSVFRDGKINLPNGATERDLAKKLAPLINQNDSIGSIAYIARQKGYDARLLIQELQSVLPENQINPQQQRDLANQGLIPKIPTLDELYLLGFSGEKKKSRQVR
jgi:hypothetical protein